MLFVDEVHRFSKAQQDALPGVENRWVTLVAADDDENPFFSVISPLLSRSLLRLESLTDDTSGRCSRRRSRTTRLGGTSASTRTRWTTWSGWPAATPAGR